MEVGYLEVITKRPISEHLKKGMMVRIFTNVIKILKKMLVRVVHTIGVISRTVMLSTSSDALLAVVGASQFCEIGIRINSPKENGFVLRGMLACEERN